MVLEQGYGGPVERPRRSLSTSAPVPNSEGEPLQDTDVQMQPPPQNENSNDGSTQTSHDSPRRCEGAVGHSPGSAELPRNTLEGSPPSRSTSDETLSGRASSHSSSAPQTWPVEPPVTRSTLSELDVSKIIHNPKLRHDINFDPELHFRPNLDGEKGRRKQERATQFWKLLKDDLTMFIVARSLFYDKYGLRNDWTLPILLKAVKEIIQTLVPQRDRPFLDEGFNIDLLMQQFHKGIADLEKLASWLCRVLKSHCAPMRDDWVDTMYKQLSHGNESADLDELVTGLRSLLSVLEAMKLDVANHQIRCLRPVLIEDTTHFEQKFFLRKIQSRKLDISGAKHWFQEATRMYWPVMGNQTPIYGELAIFFEALVRLVIPSTAEKRLPSTFLFDEERLMKLRSDILDAINLDICMRLYEDLERVGRFSAKIAAVDQGVEDEAAGCHWSPSSSPAGAFNFNTPPTISRPSSVASSSAGSSSSASSSMASSTSSRSSWVVPPYVAANPVEANPVEERNKARTVYSSLVSLLQSASPTLRPYARWQELAPSMALQIFRFTKAPTGMLPSLEKKLSETVSNVSSQVYLDAEQAFRTRLMVELSKRVGEFKGLSGVSLFAVATGGRIQSGGGIVFPGRDRDLDSSLRDGSEEGGVEDMAMRLAHLGILHWRVWAELAYVGDIGDLAPPDVSATL